MIESRIWWTDQTQSAFSPPADFSSCLTNDVCACDCIWTCQNRGVHFFPLFPTTSSYVATYYCTLFALSFYLAAFLARLPLVLVFSLQHVCDI